MDESTRRQMTWLVLAAAALSLFILAGGRRGEISRLRQDLAIGSPAQRIAAVQRLVETQKLAEALTGQPRWIQDNAVITVGYIGTEKAILQLMSCWTVVDAPVQPRIQATIARFGPLAIPALVEALTDKDAKVRAGAPGVLTAIGPPTIPYLLPLMGAWDDYIRTGVATAFGGIGKPATGDLVKVVERGEPLPGEDPAQFNRAKDCAVTSLLNMKINALDALTQELLVYKDPEVRGQAATMLGTIGAAVTPVEAPQFIPPLLKAVADDNWAVRRKGIAAMGALGQFALIGNVGPVLIQRLDDPRTEVRAAAAGSLGVIESPGVRETAGKTVATLAAAPPPAAVGAPAPAAPAAVAAAPAADPKLYRQAEAQQAATKMGAMLLANRSGASRELSVSLVRIGALAIPSLQGGLRAPDPAVRLLATQTVAAIGSRGSIVYLATALLDGSSGEVRQAASDALRNASAESLQAAAGQVTPALASALRDPQWQVYYAARDALAKIGAPAVPSLISALNSPDARVGHMAEMALTRIGAPAVPGLVQALMSGNVTVVNWASVALGEIAEPAVPALSAAVVNGSVPAVARAAAAKALGATGMANALQPLKSAAKAPEAIVRAAALRGLSALGEAGGKDNGTEELVAGLTDSDRGVRDTALMLLKNWRLDPVQELLNKVVAGSDVDASRRAAIALVFQNASVTNQLLRQVATTVSAETQKAEASLETPLVSAALDATAPVNVRIDALTALGYIGTQATIDKLKDLLQPNNPMALPGAQSIAMIGVRQSAALNDNVQDRLGQAGNMLIALVEKPASPKLGLAAAVALSNMDEIPVDKLISQLSGTTDPNTRIWSAAILAAIGKPATEKVLRQRGASKDPVQRQWLASTLQIIGDAMALQLMKHLPDEERPQPDQVQQIQEKVDLIRAANSA